MATSLYFNNYQASSEQELVENLIIESIQIHGIELWYMPRTVVAPDAIWNEDDISTFNNAYLIEAYIKNVDGFQGDGDILSKFGVQINDTITFTLSKRRYSEEIATVYNTSRPLEGDLVYFPLNHKIFKIQHVEHEAIFYQMGKLQTYDIQCELFEYSNERFLTGNPTIDHLFDKYNTTSAAAIADIDSVIPWADNIAIQKEANTLLDFSEADPFSEGGTY